MTGCADCRWVKPGITMPAQSSARAANARCRPIDLKDQRVDRVAHPKPEVERDLIVARAGGVQAPRGGADDLGEPGLDVHMDVFERARERERARLDFALDLGETLGDGVCVGGVDEALAPKHGEMRLGPRDVLGGELAVEVDRGVDRLHDLGRAGGEPAAPHRVAHRVVALDGSRMVKTENAPRRRLLLAVALAALAAVVVAAVLYGTAEPPGKVAEACPAASKALAAKLAPLARGEVAALAVASEPRLAIPLVFEREDGSKASVADFRGRAVLLNLWATWCVPCRAEMPALDRLQAAAGDKGFEVVAVNVDTARLERRGAVSRRDRRQVARPLRRSERRRVRDAAPERQGAGPSGDDADRQGRAAKWASSPAPSIGIRPMRWR